MIGDAGNLNRLYYAVKTASEIQAEHLETLCYFYLKKYGRLTSLLLERIEQVQGNLFAERAITILSETLPAVNRAKGCKI